MPMLASVTECRQGRLTGDSLNGDNHAKGQHCKWLLDGQAQDAHQASSGAEHCSLRGRGQMTYDKV